MYLRPVALALLLVPPPLAAQTAADYQRALSLRDTLPQKVVNQPGPATWIGDTHRFVYRKSVKGGHEFVVMDADSRQKRPAFDHAAVAEALVTAGLTNATALRLPFPEFRFVDNERAITFTAQNARWTCRLDGVRDCSKREFPPQPDGALAGVNGPVRGPHVPPDTEPRVSPDGKWEAIVLNHNLAIRQKGARTRPIVLSRDGIEGDAYELSSVAWSPDSTKLAAYRVRAGYRRTVHYVESSPEDQLQPKSWTLQYAKPGDVLDLEQPSIFHVATTSAVAPPSGHDGNGQSSSSAVPARASVGVRQVHVANDLFPNPYELSPLEWRRDSRTLTFEYNQRGHQVYRIIEVDAETGKARAIVSEEPKTFFYYSRSNDTRSSGKRFRHDLADGREVIWMSERDGWNHLYLIDATTGSVKSPITKGEWPVRHVQRVDGAARQIWFSAGGMQHGQDPYFLQYYRIDFDGKNLVALTSEDADHEVAYSRDMEYYVDTFSRVDLPTVSQLRRTSDRSVVAEIERTDITELLATGWKAPESFVAKGRDGRTDIWGLIFKPHDFDPAKLYPVVENIYAGPHGSHVPKTFAAYNASQATADLGFIVVQIDGMGTSNRSKVFHDVAWRDLGDAGFPDRILWHTAAAARFPWYDISRVGIYGGSAGGQNSMGALLFHPEFYKVAVSFAGCHDNRMDKIWWNEQWMGWPLGPQYSASSNVDNASKLKGKLLLVVGELDTNVDPASTMQVVNALIKAGKMFDLLVVPGENHGAGRGGATAEYGDRMRLDFFVTHLLGTQPPDWNAK